MSSWFGAEDCFDILSDNIKGFRWYVARTRSRCEKKISEDLVEGKVRHYLPLYKKANKSGRNVSMTNMPLFAGYLFVYANYDSKMLVEDIKSVACLYEVHPNQCDLFLHELINVEKALQSKQVITPTTNMIPGERIRVIKGPLSGVEGEIVRIKNKWQLVLSASMIGQCAVLEIDASHVEKLISTH